MLYKVAVIKTTQILYISERAVAPHSSTLAWKIPWTKEPVGFSPGVAGGSVVKNLLATAGDVGLIPESERSPGEGNGNLL